MKHFQVLLWYNNSPNRKCRQTYSSGWKRMLWVLLRYPLPPLDRKRNEAYSAKEILSNHTFTCKILYSPQVKKKNNETTRERDNNTFYVLLVFILAISYEVFYRSIDAIDCYTGIRPSVLDLIHFWKSIIIVTIASSSSQYIISSVTQGNLLSCCILRPTILLTMTINLLGPYCI